MNIVSETINSITNENIAPVVFLIRGTVWRTVLIFGFESFFNGANSLSIVGFLTEDTLHEYHF